jgi:putative sterol carrier protein
VNSIEEIFDLAQEYFLPEAALTRSAVVQLELSDKGEAYWFLRVFNGLLVIKPGCYDFPDVYVTVSEQDCVDIVNGDLNPLKAYMQRRVEFKGDMNKVLELKNSFRLPESFEWIRGLV